MKLEEAKQLAVKLMDHHGLLDKGWTFKFDKAKRRYGCCNYTHKVISLSAPLTEIRDMSNAKNTILHEIAHALVGRGHGHDNVWKQKALEIGCNGQRCSDDVRLKGNWIGECPNGHVVYRHRVPRKKSSCGICYPNYYNENYLITFKKKQHENNY